MKKAFSLIELSIVILIIGILVAGVTQASRITAQMRLATARNLTQSSPVNNVKNLIAWWETTSEKSFVDSETTDTAAVSNWYDINSTSITKFNAIQATSANKPTYSTNSINGLPTLKFDGSTDYFEIPFNADLNPANFTFFVATKPVSAAAYGAIFSSRSASPLKGYMLYLSPSSTYEIIVGDGASSWGSATISATMNKTYILSGTFNSGALTLYDAGSSSGPVSKTFVPTASSTFRIGAGRNESTPNYFLNGYLGELIIFDRSLKTEERQEIEKYLGKKWGVRI
jgi:prepilin-type N-terminal cleavage/methylation domain-containing protein